MHASVLKHLSSCMFVQLVNTAGRVFAVLPASAGIFPVA